MQNASNANVMAGQDSLDASEPRLNLALFLTQMSSAQFAAARNFHHALLSSSAQCGILHTAK